MSSMVRLLIPVDMAGQGGGGSETGSAGRQVLGGKWVSGRRQEGHVEHTGAECQLVSIGLEGSGSGVSRG